MVWGMESRSSDTNAGLHYDLRLEINPPTHMVSVSGSVAYHAPQGPLERARFFLHNQFTIRSITGRRVTGYNFHAVTEKMAPYAPQAGMLDVYFDPPLRKNETTLISFDYDGQITDWPAESANQITTDWAELGMYLPWYPMQWDSAPSDLTFTLKVYCPPDFSAASYGPAIHADGGYSFEWGHVTSDIVVAVGRGMRALTFESDTNRVYVASGSFGEIAAARLGEDLLWTLERYSGWFGRTRPADFTLIESPRSLGGGYARRGMMVLGGLHERDYLEQREAYLRYLAHEVAHAWWWEAPTDTWEDWLNESFAEYSALLAVREQFGEEIFQNFLQRKSERINGASPMWGFDRSDTTTPEKQATVERMLYDKGPLLLHDLAQRIGHQRFLELCRARLWSGVTSTAHLLDLVEELENGETRTWFEELLKPRLKSEE